MAVIIESKYLRAGNRAQLVDVVPLSSPYSIFIEPTNACNFRCKYCPTGDTKLLQSIGRKVKLMEFDLFCKIVDDIKAFPQKLKMVNLYKDGESLIHPRFCDMVRYLKEANVTEKIWVKTNGSILCPAMNEELVKCGLDMIGVSVQGVTSQAFYDIAGVRIDYEKYRTNILDLFARSRGKVKISVKVSDYGQSQEEKDKFIQDFSDRCDFISIEGLHGWSASERGDFRMGTDNTLDGTPIKEKIACPLTLYMLTVSASGKMAICNDAWMMTHDIGDANTESLFDIWHGEKLKKFRMMHLTGNRSKNPECGTCQYISVIPDFIDDDREEIIRKLNAV